MIKYGVFRTSASSLLFATLGATSMACGGGNVCHLTTCSDSLCTDLNTDPENCGMCGSACGAEATCNSGVCSGGPSGSGCTLPEVSCSDVCVDLQTSPGNCGACGSACAPFGECMTGACANPLALLRTSEKSVTDGPPTGRDIFVLDDVTLARTQLDATSFASGGVIDQAVLADGRVVFVGAEDTEGVNELFLASPLGGALAKLSGQLVVGGNVQAGLVISGTTILYRADQDVAGQIELFAVDANAPGVTTKLNGTLPANANVSPVVAITADGTLAAYVADQDTQGLEEAFAVELANPGVTTKLNATVTDGVWDLQLSADGTTVAYRNDDAQPNAPQLFVVAVATPGTAIHVDNALEPTYTAADVYQIAGGQLFYTGGSSLIQVGSNAVFYRAFTDGSDDDDVEALFSIGLAGGSATALSPPDVDVADFALSPDGSHIAFRTGADGVEGGNVNRGTNGPDVDTTLAPGIDELDLTTAGSAVELGSDANDGIAAGYIVLNDGRAVFMGDLNIAGQQDAFLASGTLDSVVVVSPPLGSAAGAQDATDVSQLTAF
jgi:Tol biopolymer transport system component